MKKLISILFLLFSTYSIAQQKVTFGLMISDSFQDESGIPFYGSSNSGSETGRRN